MSGRPKPTAVRRKAASLAMSRTPCRTSAFLVIFRFEEFDSAAKELVGDTAAHRRLQHLLEVVGYMSVKIFAASGA